METLVTDISSTLLSPLPKPSRSLIQEHTSSTIATTNSSITLSPHTSSTTKPATASLLADKSIAAPLLPLPPSGSLLPSPLKFLWFGRDNPSNPSKPIISETSPAETDSSQEATDGRPCTCTSNYDPKTELNNANGTSIASIIEGMQQVNHQISDANSRGWISRFLRLKLLWRTNDPQLNSRELVESALIVADHPTKTATTASDDEVANESALCCTNDPDLQGSCLLEPSHARVVHNRQSVSTFLHEVPVAEVKAISKMCLLSNLAYIIPGIQPKQLLKDHRLSFITSSLIKKEEAEAKPAKERLAIQSSKQKKKGFNKGLRTQEENVANQPYVEALSNEDVPSSDQTPLIADTIASPRQDLQAIPLLKDGLGDTIKLINEAAKMQGSCPCEWFMCDDEASSMRYLVIQGSESLASWQTNLAFEPTKFEGLGVLVHRGIYEAAQGLYNMVLPEIQKHIRRESHAKICLTGHSLGGSLATLLALMLVKRGVVKASAVEPVVTFGAPCILCGGERLLPELGLQMRQFINVVMHRDIVPRAFACDYPDHVARVLKRVNGTFRDHPCLNQQRLLYAPMGQMLILQPDDAQSPGHPLLPTGGDAGLYLIRHPSNEQNKSHAMELREAQRAFFNMPHPLDMLRDPGAYGFEGAISRDHDPRSYARAINMVLTQGLKRVKHLKRQWRRQLWWPLVVAEASLLAQRASTPCTNTDLNPGLGGPLSPALGQPSPIMLSHIVTCATAEFPRASISSSPRKNILNRYGRLIASQHIQMGVLVILSMTMDLFSSFLSWA